MLEIKMEYGQEAYNITNGCTNCSTRDIAEDIKELHISNSGNITVVALCRKCRMELMNVLAKDVGTEIPMSSFGVPYGTKKDDGIVTNVAKLADNTYFTILPEDKRCFVTTDHEEKILYIDVPENHTIHPQVHFKNAFILKENQDYIIKNICSRVVNYDEYMSGKYARINFPIKCISDPSLGHFTVNKTYDATFFLCAGYVEMSVTDDWDTSHSFDINDTAWKVTIPDIKALSCDTDSMTRLKEKLMESRNT